MKFQETDCNVTESNGLVEHVLVLSQPLPTDVIIQVDSSNGETTALCELCIVYIVPLLDNYMNSSVLVGHNF